MHRTLATRATRPPPAYGKNVPRADRQGRAWPSANAPGANGHTHHVRMSTAVAPSPSRASSRWAPRVGRRAQPWAGVLGILVLLEIIVRVGIIPSRYFPPMTTTFG